MLVTLQVLVTTIHCQPQHYQIYMVKHSLKVFQARKRLCFDRLHKLVTESLTLYCTKICFVFQICHFRLSRPRCKIQVTGSDLCVHANACFAVCCLYSISTMDVTEVKKDQYMYGNDVSRCNKQLHHGFTYFI